MFEEALRLIEKNDKIIIHRHRNPDGDALGSQIGLKCLLHENFPYKQIYAVGDDAKRYDFMDGSEMDTVADEFYNNALAIILDTSSSSLISDGRYALAQTTLRIDHHIFCEKIADCEVVDTSFESCCGLITALALEAKLKISKQAATALFTGIVTDSGRFRYDSITERTFRQAATLMGAGVKPDEIYIKLYADNLDSVRLRATFVQRITLTESNVAYIYTTEEQVKQYGVDPYSISRGMVATMSDIKDVDIWVNFTEFEGRVLCEIRSSIYNINPIAVKYGGGGHAKASGATLKSKEEAMQLLNDLVQLTRCNNE